MMAERFCGRDVTHGPHGECNGGMFASTDQKWCTRCHTYGHLAADCPTPPPHQEARREAEPEVLPLEALRDWLTEWFEAQLTHAAFVHMGDDELAAKLAADLDTANWTLRRG